MAAGPGSGKAYLLTNPALFLYRMIAATPCLRRHRFDRESSVRGGEVLRSDARKWQNRWDRTSFKGNSMHGRIVPHELGDGLALKGEFMRTAPAAP